MKNTFNDILHSDIISKTKSGFHDFVSGVKNLFRHSTGSEDEDDKSPAGKINNYLKSPEEIEAEFRFLAASQAEDINTGTSMMPSKTYPSIINKPEINFEIQNVEEVLPEYMEENY